VTLGSLQVNKAFRDILLQNGLDTMESFFKAMDVEIVKHAVPERSTVKLALREGDSQRTFFLKRHETSPLKEHLKSLLRFSRPRSAFNEWRAIIRFHEVGLPTMVPVAVGETRGSLGLVTRSFLLTEEIEEAKRLDHHLAKWLRYPLSKELISRKRELIRQLAQLTRKMHEEGLNHRDYYLCHIFIRETTHGEEFELFVMDLHRVDIRSQVGRRWIVKDLAALNYSSLKLPIHTTDRMRFLKCYLDKDHLEETDRQIMKQILRKTRRIASHAGKKRQRNRDSEINSKDTLNVH
jgi:heptose I phosphotransferase